MADRTKIDTFIQSSPHPAWLATTQGHCVYANPALERLTGFNSDQINQADWRSFLLEEDRAVASASWQKSLATETPYRAQVRMRGRDDVPKCVELIAHAMEVFANYSWPGNVRELQNFIERAVIVSPGSVLRPPLAELKQVTVPGSSSKLSTLAETEREHVLRAIRESNWVIGGPNGAAARLGMKRTTLAYRIRKLNISVRPQ
jgi:PAS domain S-box-containing protein